MKKNFIEIRYENHNTARGYMLDISKTGIAVACSKPIKKNTAIELKAKNTDLPLLKGKVIYSVLRLAKTYPHRLGIRFILSKKAPKEQLHNFIGKFEKRIARARRLSLTTLWKHAKRPA